MPTDYQYLSRRARLALVLIALAVASVPAWTGAHAQPVGQRAGIRAAGQDERIATQGARLDVQGALLGVVVEEVKALRVLAADASNRMARMEARLDGMATLLAWVLSIISAIFVAQVTAVLAGGRKRAAAEGKPR